MLKKIIGVGASLLLFGSCTVLFKRLVEPCEEAAPSCDGDVVVSCREGFFVREACEQSCQSGLCLFPDPLIARIDGFKNSMIAEDFGADGVTEIVAINRQGADPRTAQVLETDGVTLILQAPITPRQGEQRALATGHFDGDGSLDLAMMEQTPGQPDSVFFYHHIVDATTFNSDIGAAGPVVSGRGSDAIFSFDTNKDGADDVVTIEYGGAGTSLNQITLSPGTGLPTAQSQDFFGIIDQNTARVGIGDFNGDSIIDFAMTLFNNADFSDAGDIGGVQLLVSNAAGDHETLAPIATGNKRSLDIAVADLNADGSLDLAFSNDEGPSVGLLFGDNTTFAEAPGITAGAGSNAIISADLNQDEALDLIVASDTDSNGVEHSGVDVLLNRGDGTFHTSIKLLPDESAVALVSRDVNGDGAPDIIVGSFAAISVILFSPKAVIR